MTEGGIGRLLVASLHQGVADLLPSRQEFYAAWLNPANLRAGRIGLAPLAAVLSFLRQEGLPYTLVTARAGEYAAEWTVGGLSDVKRRLIQMAPPPLRIVLVGWVARGLVRQTYRSSRMDVRWKSGRGEAVIQGSIFCEVRDPVALPLCEVLRLGHSSADAAVRSASGGRHRALPRRGSRLLSNDGGRTATWRTRLSGRSCTVC